LFQVGPRFQLVRLARKKGLTEAWRLSVISRINLKCVVIRDDKFNFRWFINLLSEDLDGKKMIIPEAGEHSPETGFAPIASA
jgi:hypothetical protein